MQIGSVLIWLGSGYNPNKYNTASKNVLNFRWTKQTGDPRKWWNTTFGPNTISLGETLSHSKQFLQEEVMKSQ